jgi:hypothetical protein
MMRDLLVLEDLLEVQVVEEVEVLVHLQDGRWIRKYSSS